MHHKLLVSARDPAAAFHIVAVVRSALLDQRFVLRVVAQEPAVGYLRGAGIEVEPVDLPVATKADGPKGRALLRCAAEILTDFQPDAVLCGLSTPFDGGIDEALLAKAEVPTFLMQDFWGEKNSFFGRQAETFLVLDGEAARLSRLRHAAAPIVVGSPRHSFYADLDIVEVRARTRAKLNVSDETAVLGFFGQALHDLPGYVRTVEAWCEAVACFNRPHLGVYRPHPRENAAEIRMTRRLLDNKGIQFICLDGWTVEEALLCSDVVCSAFSNCTYDVAYLNHFSASPLATPVSLFFDPGVVDYFRRIVRLEEFPYLKAELVLPVYHREELAEKLLDAATLETKRRFWRAAKDGLIDPVGASERVLDVIATRLSDAA